MIAPLTVAARRVLVVEDDYFIAQEMRRGLAAGGTEVLGPVGDVDDALALIARTPGIDGAVLDINLHDVMVFPVADALRARGVPFVFATGYDWATIPARFADVQRCEKPVEPATVAKALFS